MPKKAPAKGAPPAEQPATRGDFNADVLAVLKAVFGDDENIALEKFKDMINSRQDAWRRIVGLGVTNGVGLPAFSGSLAYYDSYRRARLPGS